MPEGHLADVADAGFFSVPEDLRQFVVVQGTGWRSALLINLGFRRPRHAGVAAALA
jgi:hypothetical protein